MIYWCYFWIRVIWVGQDDCHKRKVQYHDGILDGEREGASLMVNSPLCTQSASSKTFHEYLYPASIQMICTWMVDTSWKLCGLFFSADNCIFYYWCEGRREVWLYDIVFLWNTVWGVWDVCIYIYLHMTRGGGDSAGEETSRLKAAYKSIAITFYFKWEGGLYWCQS